MGYFLYKTRIGVKFLDFSLVVGRNSDAEYQAANCFTNVLEDVLDPTAISGHFDRCRKNIVLNLLRYFIRPYPFYFRTNGFYWPVGSVATTLLSLREVWGSWVRSLGRSNRTQCRQRLATAAIYFRSSKLCCPGAKRRSPSPRHTLRRIIPKV